MKLFTSNRDGVCKRFLHKAEAHVDYVISHYRAHFTGESHLDNREHCLKWRYLRVK